VVAGVPATFFCCGSGGVLVICEREVGLPRLKRYISILYIHKKTMSILSIIAKGIEAMIDEATTPESFKMGEKFENYVRDFLFVDNYYDIVERTHNYKTNKDYVESSLKPDFTFRDRWAKREFYVEVKFRTGLYKDKISWCNEKQLARYQAFSKTKPSFLILGMGENPKYPEFLSLIPFSEAKYTGLFPSFAEKFAIELDKPVSSKTLWNR
jgi:hypothetical protein